MTFDPDFASAAEWARLYRAHHIQVVPAWLPSENKSWKRPLLPSWTEYQQALVPDSVFEPWYGPSGQYVARPNMGAICGIASDNLMIIDLDDHKTIAAAQWWHGLLELHHNGMELETVEQRTGGGGRQKLFRCPSNWTPPTNKTPIGVDIRGQGGFAMLAPSIHESGQAYEWLEGRSPDELEIAMAPDWLMEAVDELVGKYSGTSVVKEKTSAKVIEFSPYGNSPTDGFGHQTDLREDKMFRLIWGAVVDWYRECPIKPSDQESMIRMAEKYLIYQDLVTSRLHDPSQSKMDLLDQEGRGPAAFHVKWQRAMAQWETKVRDEANNPPEAKQTKQPEQTQDKSEFDGPAIQPISGPLIQTSAEFLAAYTPPAYLIDGILQRGYLYSLTARTGHGKTAVTLYFAQAIARGMEMHGCKVLPGTVLILAGENPDDVRARYFVLGKAYGFDPTIAKIRWIPGVKHLPSHMEIIRREMETIDDLVLVLVDTAAAYFPGTETNSNSEQGAYARLLRELTFLKGKPAVIALCHPVKNAARDNLLPMGGSAFTNEVDGNLTLWSGNEKQTTLHWQGKFRGPEFDPIVFEMAQEYCDTVKDESGRLLPSVVAKPMSQDAVEASEDAAEKDEDRLMRALYEAPRASLGKLAGTLGWKKRKVQTNMYRLTVDKLVIQVRNQKYELTDKGRDAIGALKGGK